MADTENWEPARLIPTSGITGTDEAERRATSALLAVMESVKEFSVALLKTVGAPAGRLSTFIEVPLLLADERHVIPDGALHVTRGQTSWLALVEVKTGTNELRAEQVESYLDAAREQGFDCVLTISNQLSPAAGVHPVVVDGRKLRKVGLFHLSWAEILTLAVQIRVHQGVSDPDQAWILGELIRYLEHPKSGTLDFSDMGSSWVTTRDAVAAGTLRSADKGVIDVASRWDQLLRFTALRLGRELGADVQVVVPRKEAAEPATRLSRFVEELAGSGFLTGSIRIPDTIAPIDVHVDLRSLQVTVSVEVGAPQEGRPTTRVSWLTRQLRDSPDQLRIDGILSGTRQSTSELLVSIRDEPTKLVDPQGRAFRSFRVAATSPVGTKRNTGRGAFIDSVIAAVDGFYEDVVQVLRPWSAKAPQLPTGGRTAAEEAGIDTKPSAADLAEAIVDAAFEDEESDGVRADLAEEVALDLTDPDYWNAQPPPFVPTSELVSWGDAEERLAREREATHDSPGYGTSPV